MTRVLHVLKYYRPDFTGEGVFLERSSAVMQEVAPSVHHELLVTRTPRPAGQVAACSTLDRVIYLSARKNKALRHEAKLAWWFLRNIRRYDTVHFRTHVDWYFVTYVITRLAGRRMVLSATLDDSLPVLTGQYRPSLRPLAARAFRLFQAYVSISPKLLDETLSAGVSPDACHLIPCGVTVPPQPSGTREGKRQELGAAPDDLLLLFAGGLCRRKDPMFLLEALPDILARAPNARLVLIGPPLERDYVAALHETARRLGVTDRVLFAGEQQNPHPWFAAADILVFASRMEGFGTVVPEAMSHGLPVIVRRLPGVNDSFVLEGETGHLFDTTREYVDAVLRLAPDPALRQRLGAAGRALARARFGMRTVARRYLELYGLPAPDAAPEALPDPAALAAPAVLSGVGGREPAATEEETGLGSSAAILDRRFHTPVALRPDRQPLLMTTVDAEEAFDWSRPFSRSARDVTSMGVQQLAHRVFERHGVVPVYLTDYPVAAQDAGRAPLRELLQSGLCEVGAQMHPWVTPPFDEVVSDHNSFAGNLPVALELEKARRLTGALEDAFGEAPLIYRTGRFGVGPRTGDVLKSLGYLVDTSVAPCWQPVGGGRWGSWGLSARPYWVDRDRSLMEIPVTSGLVGHLARRHGERLAPAVFNPRMVKIGLPGVLSKLGLLERIRLSPEGMTLDEAKRLVRYMLAHGQRVFLLTYHSPSLAPGNTPYVRTAEDRDRFLAWLDAFYTFFAEELGGRFGSWRDVRFQD
ncbi:MAG TPA: glycosyltransferase, partial [Roseomonas sp.]